MLDHILIKVPPEFLILASVPALAFMLLAAHRPHVCFALAIPCYLFVGQLNVSVSASTAMCVLMASVGCLLRQNVGADFELDLDHGATGHKHATSISGNTMVAGDKISPPAASHQQTRQFGLKPRSTRGSKVPFGRSEKLLLGLALLVLVSTSYTSNPAYGIDKATLFCFLCVPVVIIAPQVITGIRALRTVVSITTVTFLVYVLASTWPQAGGISIADRSSALADVTRAGQFFGLAAIIGILHLSINRASSWISLFIVCLIGVSLVLLLRSGTRSALLSMMVALTWAYWYVHKDWLASAWKYFGTASASLLLAVVLWLVGPVFLHGLVPHHVLVRFTSINKLFDNFTAEKITYWEDSTSRTVNYFSALEGIKAHPLRGVGAGGYAEILGMYVNLPEPEDGILHAYPHNLLLEFGVEQGIPGLLLFLLILKLNHDQLLALRKIALANREHLLLITYVACFYIYGLCVSMTALDVPRMMILWWGMGLLFATRRVFLLAPPSRTATRVTPESTLHNLGPYGEHVRQR